jgi:hypothetical protein
MATKPVNMQHKEPEINSQVQACVNVPEETIIIPLDGKLISAAHPTEVGKNFTSLVNMRYGDKHPEGVLGMTKINTNTLSPDYLHARSTFQFINETYSENHILVQAYQVTGWSLPTIGTTPSEIFDNEAPIPVIGEFNANSIWVNSPGASIGLFSTAPGGQMAYCNGVDTCLWGGHESRVAAFIRSSTALTSISDVPGSPVDYTEKITNRMTDTNNIVAIEGGSDQYTSLLLHCDTATPNWVDSSNNTHTVTAHGAAALNTTTKKFGDGSVYMPATGDYLSVPAHSSLAFGSGDFTVGFEYYTTETGQSADIIRQYDDANNYFRLTVSVAAGGSQQVLKIGQSMDVLAAEMGKPPFYVEGEPSDLYLYQPAVSGAQKKIVRPNGRVQASPDIFNVVEAGNGTNFVVGEQVCGFKNNLGQDTPYGGSSTQDRPVWITQNIAGFPQTETISSGTYLSVKFIAVSGGVTVADYTSTNIPYTTKIWRNFELVRHGSDVLLFVDGVAVTLVVATAISTNALPTLTGAFQVGSAATATSNKNYLDEVRVSKGIARHTTSFSPPADPYGATGHFYLVASTRPAQGMKFYIETPNTEPATTMSVSYFNGFDWAPITTTGDTTSSGGVTLANDGSVSWHAPSLIPQKRYLEGYYLYWYQFSISGGSAKISHMTMDMPFQNIIDLWDGTFASLSSAYKTGTNTTDIVLNINEYSYESLDNSTYAELHGLVATTQYIEVGFLQKVTAMFIAIPSEYQNTTAATTMTVSYWNGSSYIDISDISDGTSSGSISLSKSGIVSWVNSNSYFEAMKSVQGGFPMYYYKISFDKNLAGSGTSMRLYFTAAIPFPQTVKSFAFPVHAADRLMLGCETTGERNALLISAQNAPDVFNGPDSYRLRFGDSEALTCGCTIFAQYSASVYNFVIIFKKNETWSLSWSENANGIIWNRYRLSPSVGCPAPLTLRVASVAFDKNVNQTKVLAIWRGANGIYVTNGQAPLCVSNDISDVFDQSSDVHVNQDMLNYEYGFIDGDNNEYHWLWASNECPMLNKEYVLDMTNWQWYEVDRTLYKTIRCGTNVRDSYGNEYAYAFGDSGYLWRLNDGADFDGESIVCTMQFGDQLLAASNLFWFTELRKVNLIAVSKTDDTDVTLTHYRDGSPTGLPYTLSTEDAVHSYCNYVADIYSDPAIFHGFKLQVTSAVSMKGFEPLFLAMYVQKIRENRRAT